MCLPTWRRAGKRFRQGRGVPPPVVYLVVGESRAGRWAGGGRSSNACILSLELQTLTVTRPVENRGSYFRARRARDESFIVFPPPARRTPECRPWSRRWRRPPGCRVSSWPRPRSRRCSPRLRSAESRAIRLPRATSQSSGQIVAPRSTHAREQPSSAPLPRISSSRFALTVASELKNYDKLATTVPRTMSRSLCMYKL